ncbi:uncharacterized protein F4822DRAFT_392985 [Hypoxylon trugodes]|uniref:uncharacterized protein n=1 Tax=Hypoxylon trugodes TaxID=326681 RepID=UPI0021950A7B|nr:uncharacterized protein F4822DRAFT_392985 [Hypoxylon trugodes]KAI1393056.1 hypothetical protein F4822DRAFT_392985 [Hypoxylon trugodes]
MASLLDLPVEVLNHILESLDGNDKPTFFQLSLVCNALKELVTPIMYRTVVLWELNSKTYQGAPVPSFLYSILSSPTRASMVKTFAITSSACQATAEMVDFDIFRARLRELAVDKTILDLWEKYIFDNRKSWTDNGLSGCTALLAALNLPNLNTLFFGGTFTYWHWDLLNSILRNGNQVTDRDPGCDFWPKLDAVTIHNMWDKNPENTAPLMTFASLPNIKRLSGILLLDMEVAPETILSQSPAPYSTELEELVIQPGCYLHQDYMEILLQAPKNLQVFKTHASRALANTTFKTRWLEGLLSHQSHALREISLTHSFYESEEVYQASEFDEVAEIDPMSLSSFTSLETLEISSAFVFGREALQLAKDKFFRATFALDPSEGDIESTRHYIVQMLPGSIRTLRFAQCNNYWELKRLNSALMELFTGRDELFPNLKVVEVHMIYYQKTDWASQLHGSRLAAIERGIDFRVFKGGRLGVESVGGESVRNVYSLHYADGDARLQEIDIHSD